MNKTSFGSFNAEDLKNNYKEHLKDESFNVLVKSLKANDNELMKHTSNLEKTVNELKYCQNWSKTCCTTYFVLMIVETFSQKFLEVISLLLTFAASKRNQTIIKEICHD